MSGRPRRQGTPLVLPPRETCMVCSAAVEVPAYDAVCSKRCRTVQNMINRAEKLRGNAIRRAGGLTDLDRALGVKPRKVSSE